MKNMNVNKKNNFLNAKNGYMFNDNSGQEFESVKEYFSRALVTPLLSAVEEKELASPERLFDQDASEDEDFEIPAFLRRQKF